METKVTLERFKELLPLICDKETSSDPEYWTPENPLWGHCAVVSLVAQNIFGGKLARASLENTEFAKMGSHYWNILPYGFSEDFTKPQFQGKETVLTASERTREYVLYDPKTGKQREIMNRYKLLAYRLAKALSGNNPLFDDTTYKRCFYAALESPCQKKKFGCVIFHHDEVIYDGCNKTIKPLKSFCEPSCIRLSIQSRTESMTGACGHAEEMGLWEVIHRDIPINDCSLYVAGININCLPLIKENTDFTCLRCAVQMYNARIKSVYMPVIDHWWGISPEQAVITARAYATGEKKV